MELADQLRAVGIEAGLSALGFCDASPFDEARAAIEAQKAAGRHGGMQFTYRNPARSTSPTSALPGARSLVVGALSFHADSTSPPDAPVGRIAKYVWSDHYRHLRTALEAVAVVLIEAGYRTRILCDDNALVDRAAARRSGIGWQGKNTNILVPGFGSNVVLGSILTDAELAPGVPLDDGCGSCVRCVPACPTGALDDVGSLDATKCLAWLVQADGVFPREHRVALGDRIYGCDACQVVCPPNSRAARVHVSLRPVRPWAPLLALLELDDDELLDQYGSWYIPRRDPRYLRRNALIALGNTGDGRDPKVQAVLERYLDPGDDLVCSHAIWAARRLTLPVDLDIESCGPLSRDEMVCT